MKTLAIIGVGPRGLSALENLLLQLSHTEKSLKILAFESTNFPGAGSIWNPQQSSSNWINIAQRCLSCIKERPEILYKDIHFPGFPSFNDWDAFTHSKKDVDKYPPRKYIGNYLHERFLSLNKVFEGKNYFNLVNTTVKHIIVDSGKYILEDAHNNTYECDNVLLTMGHQPTKLSKQLISWNEHASEWDNIYFYQETYPLSQFDKLKEKKGLTIAVRGFGLTFLDLIRELCDTKYGTFQISNNGTIETVYIKNDEQNLRIIPFSLDGKPPVPKPYNEYFDSYFKPTEHELEYLQKTLEPIKKGNNIFSNIDFYNEAIANITIRVYRDLPQKFDLREMDDDILSIIIMQYLSDADYRNDLLQNEDIPVQDLIEAYNLMALGRTRVCLDYCLWQVWRHCQTIMHDAFSYADIDSELLEAMVAIDERSKRYTYGPPVTSMQQVLALVKAGIVDLNFVKNPDIKLVKTGWEIHNLQNVSTTASIMINSVLDPAKLLEVKSSIVKELLNDHIIKPIHSEMGIHTDSDGFIVSRNKSDSKNIAVLGRLAKGSVLGVDGIDVCFGNNAANWAKALVEKLPD